MEKNRKIKCSSCLYLLEKCLYALGQVVTNIYIRTYVPYKHLYTKFCVRTFAYVLFSNELYPLRTFAYEQLLTNFMHTNYFHHKKTTLQIPSEDSMTAIVGILWPFGGNTKDRKVASGYRGIEPRTLGCHARTLTTALVQLFLYLYTDILYSCISIYLSIYTCTQIK